MNSCYNLFRNGMKGVTSYNRAHIGGLLAEKDRKGVENMEEREAESCPWRQEW